MARFRVLRRGARSPLPVLITAFATATEILATLDPTRVAFKDGTRGPNSSVTISNTHRKLESHPLPRRMLTSSFSPRLLAV